MTEDEKDKNTWLMEEVPGVPVQKSRQSKLIPWSGNKLMAREMVMEVLGAAWESMKATKVEEVIAREQEKETASVARRAEEVEVQMEMTAKSKTKPKKNKKIEPKDLRRTATQDIRSVLERNREQAKRNREERVREREEGELLIRIADETEQKYKEQEARSERRKRAANQQKQLLQDIRIRAERAQIRLLDNQKEEIERSIGREQRRTRAEEQRAKTLERIHKMDWITTEIKEEGEGKRADAMKKLTLVCATSVEGERKRKRSKKLRWTEAAKWRARGKGQVRRILRRAGRRLPPEEEEGRDDTMDWDIDEMEYKVGEEQKVHNLTTLMADMMVKEEESRRKGEQDKEIRQVGELLAELTIQTEGVVEWERIAHDWLENLPVDE